MDNAEVAASGSLYSLSPEGALKTLISGVRISNGLTWSPDAKTFYYIATPTRQIVAPTVGQAVLWVAPWRWMARASIRPRWSSTAAPCAPSP